MLFSSIFTLLIGSFNFVPNESVEKVPLGSEPPVFGGHLTLPSPEIVQYSAF
jgi:hypothetical protein